MSPLYIDELHRRLVDEGVPASRAVSFTRLTTFRVGGQAAVLGEPDDREQLLAALRVARELSAEVLVIGRGSNVLVSDRGFDGLVLRLGRGFTAAEVSGTRLIAGAAMALPQAANAAARKDLSGLEFAVAIPGSVGGGVRMNAGAHGGCLGDVLTEAEIADLATGECSVRHAPDLELGYRRSSIGGGQVVLSATFELEPGDPDEIASMMRSHRDHRAATQPTEAPNAGSMFANPDGDSAGRLIEASGSKGMKMGRAEVSLKHANFFLAHPGATAQEVFDLMAAVQERVMQQMGVLLRPEVRIIGFFEARDRLREVG